MARDALLCMADTQAGYMHIVTAAKRDRDRRRTIDAQALIVV